jgi:hypothetical protein
MEVFLGVGVEGVATWCVCHGIIFVVELKVHMLIRRTFGVSAEHAQNIQLV